MLLLLLLLPQDSLGEQIRQHLRRRGLSQQELARLIGTTEPWLSRVMQGHRLPSLALLQRIIAVLELEGIEEAQLWAAWKEAKQQARGARPAAPAGAGGEEGDSENDDNDANDDNDER